jgi:hypothetical protein
MAILKAVSLSDWCYIVGNNFDLLIWHSFAMFINQVIDPFFHYQLECDESIVAVVEVYLGFRCGHTLDYHN